MNVCKIIEDLKILRGSELEGEEGYPCGAAKINLIRKDQVFKPKLKPETSNKVASSIRSYHCYSLTIVALI